VVSKYAFVLEVSREEVAKLANSPIVFSRTPTPTGETHDASEDWDKRSQKIYQKMFGCINENL
jgi:hypothetical protein